MPSTISTTFFIVSDSHGQALEHRLPTEPIDVAIHCGDLTEKSKLSEFRATLDTLNTINASLKLVIAGNHDWTLDDHIFKQKLTELRRVYGDSEDMDSSVERMHEFTLANGARLKVFASRFTPSTNDWGFQYDPASGKTWAIDQGVDIVITHSPPRGVLDTVEGVRAGRPDLFKAVARARPLMHCYGHIHSGWGAKLVAWRKIPTEESSHFTDIDGSGTRLIEDVRSLTANDERDSAALMREKHTKHDKYQEQVYCDITDISEDIRGSKTIFVNAALENKQGSQRFPWLVKLNLRLCDVQAIPKSTATSSSNVVLSEKNSARKRKASEHEGGEATGRPLKVQQ